MMIYQEKAAARHPSKGGQVKVASGRRDHAHQYTKSTLQKSQGFSSSSPSSSLHGRDTNGGRAERETIQNGKRKFQPVNPNARQLVSWNHCQNDASADEPQQSPNEGTYTGDRTTTISQHQKTGVRSQQPMSRVNHRDQYTVKNQNTETAQSQNQLGVREQHQVETKQFGVQNTNAPRHQESSSHISASKPVALTAIQETEQQILSEQEQVFKKLSMMGKQRHQVPNHMAQHSDQSQNYKNSIELQSGLCPSQLLNQTSGMYKLQDFNANQSQLQQNQNNSLQTVNRREGAAFHSGSKANTIGQGTRNNKNDQYFEFDSLFEDCFAQTRNGMKIEMKTHNDNQSSKIDFLNFDTFLSSNGLYAEPIYKDYQLQQQSSTAQPKTTLMSSKLGDDGMRAVRRERMGRSHAPKNKNDPSVNTQVVQNNILNTDPALSMESKKMDNFSNEKTSATGSNLSTDSPKQNLFKQICNLGSLSSTKKLFQIQNPELVDSINTENKAQQRQPMYRQILASHGVDLNAGNNDTKPVREHDPFAGCDYLEDMDFEIDKDQEKLWEKSMSNLIDQMQQQLQIDFIGQQTYGQNSKNNSSVVDRFVESEEFQWVIQPKVDFKKDKNKMKLTKQEPNYLSNGYRDLQDAKDGNRLRDIDGLITQNKEEMKEYMPSITQQKTSEKTSDETHLYNVIQFENENEIMTPVPKEKSVLRNLSIILEARESIISLKNDESALRKEAKLELTGASLEQVHKEAVQQQVQYASCFNAGEDQSQKSKQSQQPKEMQSNEDQEVVQIQSKFFEKSACFDIPNAENVPVGLFD